MSELNFGAVFASFDQLLLAAMLSIAIGVVAMLLALLIGMIGTALSQIGWQRAVIAFVDVFRGTPLLVQILVLYFVPNALGIPISPYVSGTISLAVYYGAYTIEIMRGAFEAVPAEHIDAARALGMTRNRIFFKIQFPQVLAVIVSPLAGQFARLVKASSLLSVIGVAELTHRGQFIMERTYAPIETWLTVAAIYFALNSVVVILSIWLERRLVRSRA
jgi:His/Glu/Gln/Arg/opine family amino acid ABC transporter permease subunit